MFSIDIKTDPNYYIIKKDGKEYCRVSKRSNDLETVKKHFSIEVVEKWFTQHLHTSSYYKCSRI